MTSACTVLRVTRLQTASLFLFCCAFFLVLMSGHIYARDEETLFQMTDGITLHGEPLVSPEVWGIVDSSAPSKHGLRPTSYAPGQPLIAVPLYWLGRAVGAAAGPSYAVYLTRFVVLTFNVFATAAMAALLFRFALAFGYRGWVGVALAVCYSVGTFALIQARTFFAEPLTACLVLLSFLLLRQAGTGDVMDRRQRALLIGSGFASGAALLVKIHAALFVPMLALYLVLTVFPMTRSLRERSAWRLLLMRGICWGGGFAGPLPALPLLDRLLMPGWGAVRTAARTGAVAVLLAGMFVQSLAIAVSFDIPILTSTSDHARAFTLAQSPIVLAARTARSRLTTWWSEEHPAANSFMLARGLYPSEGDTTSLFPRWTDGQALVALHPRGGAAVHIKLTYFDHRPAPMRATATPVTLSLGAETLAPVDRLAIAPANERFILAYDLSPALLHTAGARLTIRTPTWNPATAGVSDRNEPLGIRRADDPG
ncbi:MAG: hypothetical protein ACR2JW_09530 [Thermomicrobiales bacterium]